MKFHMIHAPRFDMHAFHKWSVDRALIKSLRAPFDPGYAAHVLLSSMFGKSVLHPFRLFSSDSQRYATLYAYSDTAADKLMELSNDVATPDCLSVLNVNKIQSKAMPTKLTKGRKLGFDIYVRPVSRVHKEINDSQSGKTIGKGSEVDVFRLEVLRKFPNGWKETGKDKNCLSREEIYMRWLGERLSGVAKIESCILKSFIRAKVCRGGKFSEGPNAVLHGDLVIEDADKFMTCLHKGIGRHKAYGYGMLLLRPPNNHSN